MRELKRKAGRKMETTSAGGAEDDTTVCWRDGEIGKNKSDAPAGALL